MKKLQVTDQCNGCGVCIVNCSYLQENDEGNAVAVPGKYINEQDLPIVQKIIKDCPEQALSLIDVGGAARSGKAGAKEIIEKLKEYRKTFSVKRISGQDVPMDCKKYSIPVPHTNLEYRDCYSSESKARSAAKDEFRRLCYSEAAYGPMLKKIFVEYRVDVLRPYYLCEDTPDSIFYSYNQEIREYLADMYATLQEVYGNTLQVPSQWKSFSVYPDRRKYSIVDLLNEYDYYSDSSGIMEDFKSSSYTQLSEYIDMMDFDYNERYEGSGLFGDKHSKNWYFTGFNKQVEEFVSDLKSSVDCMSYEISERAANITNEVLGLFEDRVQDELDKKIKELEGYIG